MNACPGLSQLIGPNYPFIEPQNKRMRNDEARQEWVEKNPEARGSYESQERAKKIMAARAKARARRPDDDEDDEDDSDVDRVIEQARLHVQNRRYRNIGAKHPSIEPQKKRMSNDEARQEWDRRNPGALEAHERRLAKRWINEKIRKHREKEAAARAARAERAAAREAARAAREAEDEDSSDSEDELLNFVPFARRR